MKRVKGKEILLLLSAALLMTGCADYGKDELEEGTSLLETGDYEEAFAQFQTVLDKTEDQDKEKALTYRSEAYRGMGIASYEQQDYEAARTYLQQALDEGGEETPALDNMLGVCAMNLGDYESALSAFSSGITLAEDGSDEEDDALIQEMRWNKISCLEKNRDWENAKTEVSSYVADYPEDEEAQKEYDFLSTR